MVAIQLIKKINIKFLDLTKAMWKIKQTLHTIKAMWSSSLPLRIIKVI